MTMMIRTFIAIELPSPVQEALATAQDRLRQAIGRSDSGAVSQVRWVAPQSIHLTLKFLGDVPAERIPVVTQAVTQAASGFKPVSLALSDAGCFPNLQRPRVVWVGLQGDLEALEKLQKAVEGALARLGFPKEERAFTPHLTLGRVRDAATAQERRSLGEATRGLVVPQVRFTAEEIAVMRSDLQPAGAVYTRLAAAPLAGKPPNTVK